MPEFETHRAAEQTNGADRPTETIALTGSMPFAADTHPAQQRWHIWLAELAQAMAQWGISPGRAVVLVPYAQLMAVARQAWAQAYPSGFAPRFESTRNWAHSLQPFVPGPNDLSMDMATDSWAAAALLERMTAGRSDAALRSLMVSRLVEASWQLAPLAAAVPPAQREAWATARREALAQDLPAALEWENLLATLALLWVGGSRFATDVLWLDAAQPGVVADALLVLPGYQDDPLTTALASHWGERARVLYHHPAPETAPATAPALHACTDAEDEAQRAAACVLAHANAGRLPVALVDNDRLLTRRVSALLHNAGMAVRDETGWKLSTTHAAAQCMSLLRAADARAPMDDVLDLLKQTRQWPEAEVSALEQAARQFRVTRWRAAVASTRLADRLPAGLADALLALQKTRSLPHWLADLRTALQAVGLWQRLLDDAAGQQLLAALHLNDDTAHTLDAVAQVWQADTAKDLPARRISLASFTAWVRNVLESASFVPPRRAKPTVVILPMAQLLGRRFAATVVPGCDETHLNPSPEPPGHWTAAQREVLGLPAREALAQSAWQAWLTAVQQPHADLLWRTQVRGEVVLPSPWVQLLCGNAPPATAPDPRHTRSLAAQPQTVPAPSAPHLLTHALSASAYQDLRDCPYRFFALRQLRLAEAPELQEGADPRDLGNWLHAVLRAFHEQRGDQRPGLDADRSALNQWAQQVADSMGLSRNGGADFLPIQAVWPALREGYLQWLSSYEATAQRPGPRFDQAEAALTMQTETCQLDGKLDRIDQQDSPEGTIPIVIDYKTESRSTTQARVKDPLEDTQLAFYAALLPHDNLRAAYLSITDQRGQAALLVEQPHVLLAREHLLAGLAHDMGRIRQGHPMPALGEGRVCDFCHARGLCRKDFWSAPA